MLLGEVEVVLSVLDVSSMLDVLDMLSNILRDWSVGHPVHLGRSGHAVHVGQHFAK